MRTIFWQSERANIEQPTEVLDVLTYWNMQNHAVFPTTLSALYAVNDKARQLLDLFANFDPPSSDIVRSSLKNLRTSHTYCEGLLKRMRGKTGSKVQAFGQDFISVELAATGLKPDRPSQTETISEHVKIFAQELDKTARFVSNFQDIVDKSNWPKYVDIKVEFISPGLYSINKKAKYRALEYAIIVIGILASALFIFIKVKQVYLHKVSDETS